MAATNRADILDPALLRPGRFDRQIHVNLPDVRGREQILKVHARNKPLAPDVNFKILSRMTSGFSGADLENLLNEAAILTARAGKKMIGNKELFEGINKVLLGPQKKSQPCIVFIDEIDAVGRQRGTGLGGGHDEREQTLNQLPHCGRRCSGCSG